MKTKKTLALLLLVGFLGSGCATVSRLNAEYEEELIRIEQMSPEEKADFEKARQERADRVAAGPGERVQPDADGETVLPALADELHEYLERREEEGHRDAHEGREGIHCPQVMGGRRRDRQDGRRDAGADEQPGGVALRDDAPRRQRGHHVDPRPGGDQVGHLRGGSPLLGGPDRGQEKHAGQDHVHDRRKNVDQDRTHALEPLDSEGGEA